MTGVTEAIALRPTQERIRKADHFDQGDPLNSDPKHQRSQRLGTAWDRYSRDRDKDGKLLPCDDMILTRPQIAAGENYINAWHNGQWGGAVGSKMEPSVSGSFTGPPAHALDAQKERAKLESRIRPRYLVSLLQAVLIDGYSADTWAGATGRHPKGGIGLLRVTLDMLCDE